LTFSLPPFSLIIDISLLFILDTPPFSDIFIVIFILIFIILARRNHSLRRH